MAMRDRLGHFVRSAPVNGPAAPDPNSGTGRGIRWRTAWLRRWPRWFGQSRRRNGEDRTCQPAFTLG
jgi:hypothetical protein